jgi:hypothetical protein
VKDTGVEPENPTDDEQNNEEGGNTEETPGDNDTPVIETPDTETPEESPEDPAEPSEEEVVNPTTDPEDPTVPEEPEDTEDTNTVNGAEVDADEATYTVTISNYATLKNQVAIEAIVGDTPAKIPSNGALTVTGDASAPKATSLTLTAKPGYKITEVKKGEDTVTAGGDGTYSIPNLTADTTISVNTVAVYTISLDNTAAENTSLKVKTGETTTTVSDSEVKLERGELSFTVDGYTATADDRLKVYYVEDGSSDDDTTEIEGVESTTGEGEAAVTTTTYTVPAAKINALDESIKIILVKETKGTVTFEENTKVTVQYWGKKNDNAAATDLAEAWVVESGEGANNTKYDKITKAFVGDTFKFKVTGVDPWVVSKVKIGTEEITLQTTGEYSVTVTEEMLDADNPAKISFETVYDSAKSRTLTYTLTGDEGSATAKITSVTPAGTEETPGTATTTDADMAAALGIAEADLILESGKALSVLAAPTEIKVTITPVGDYELVAATGETLEANGSLVKTYTGTSLTSAIAIAATTQEKALAGSDSKYFKASIKNGSENLSALTLVANTNVKPATGEGSVGVYEVKPGARNVAFTVTAKEGFKLKDITGMKITAGTPAANGDVVYTVAVPVAMITGADVEHATVIEVEEEAITLTASKKAAEGSNAAEFGVAMETKGTAEGDSFVAYTEGDEIAFGSAFKATITPAKGCRLDEVSYVMGTAAAVTVPVTLNDADKPEVLIEIPKMTGDVTITVKSGKDYALTTLTDSTGNEIEQDSDKIYHVEYGKKYLVGVQQGNADVPAKDVTVVVKDETGATVAMSNPIISGKRSINLANKNLAGQEITADIFVKGVENAVGTYIMSVEKKTTAITVNGGNAIAQSVDSVATYDLTTDGDIKNVSAIVGGDATLKSLIRPTIDRKTGKLQVAVDPASRDEIATSATTGTGAEAVTTWTAKKAKITVSATDDPEVEASVEITLTALFNEDAAPTVELVDAADTVLNVKVGMDEVAAPKTGSVWYKVTATAKANTPASGDTPASNKPDNMQSTVTEIVRKTGSSNRVALQVADSSNLGEGAEWSYDVTAQLFYMDTNVKPAASVAAADAKAVSKEGKLEGAATKTPLFEDALKLKKAKGAPAKLYTGQTEDIVIAEPQWTKKFNSYKIVSDQMYDNYSDFKVDVNEDGNIILKGGVPVNAHLGKHTITVVATADEYGKDQGMGSSHTTYASRATISVNVVKGINNIIVTQPSENIYKDPKKAGTLKLGVDYNHKYLGQVDDYHNDYASSNGKKYISAPATKKVTWSIVDANSTTSNIIAAPAYLNVNDKKSGVSVKNGTVTVAKGFTRDERHANNNQFKVLVEAADFKGNTTKALSNTITITADALDISTLVIVHENEEYDHFVTAVHDIKDKKPVEVLASDVDGGRLYALPTSAAVTKGAKWTNRLERAAVPVGNLTMTATNKKILTVDEDGYLGVLAAGKKAGVKVVTNDGGKKTHTMTLTLGYKETAGSDLALGIDYRTGDNNFYSDSKNIFAPTGANVAKANKANVKETPVEAKFTATGAARLDVYLYIGNKADGTSTAYTQPADKNFTNYKLAVKGGKAIYNKMGYATIITTAKETTLTLTDQTKEAKAAKKKPYVYKIVNEAYDNTKLLKAPKVTVKGSLYGYGTAKEQNNALKLTVLNAAERNALFAKDKTVKVELDWSARTDKNAKMLNEFAEYLKLNKTSANTTKLGETGIVSLFDGHENDDTINLYVGSYKLKVTVGHGDGSNFVAETLPATINVKVAKLKAFTFKPTTTYTINKIDGGAVLTGKSNVNVKAGELTYMNFDQLQNVNLKGKSNKFTHYFKIEEDPVTDTQRLTLNTDDDLVKAMLYDKKADGTPDLNKPLDDPAITIPKEDLTGYIHYYAGPSVNYYSNHYVSGTVKITVKIAPEVKPGKAAKPSQKYAANRAEVALTANAATEMNVIVNGAYVSIAYAMVDADKKGNAEELAVDLAGNKKGQIVLKTTKAVEEGKTYSTNLLIVPNSSFYKTLIDKATAATAAKEGEAAAAATKQDLIKKYGIAIKVSVLASKTPVKTPDPTPVGGGEEPEVKTAAQAKALLEAVDNWTTKAQKSDAATLDASKTAETEADLLAEVQGKLASAGFAGEYAATVAKSTATGSDLTLSDDKNSATVKFDVTVNGETEVVSVTIAAELATQTPEKTATEVATEIQTAVQAEVDKETGSAVPAITWDGTQSNEDRISNAAAIKTAIDTAVTDSDKLADGFTASKATDATFTITSEPTASATGTATITLTITKTADSTTGTVTISLTIPVTTA